MLELIVGWYKFTLLWPGGFYADTETAKRVVRGGGWSLAEVLTRCAHRFWLDPMRVYDYVGFRVASSPKP